MYLHFQLRFCLYCDGMGLSQEPHTETLHGCRNLIFIFLFGSSFEHLSPTFSYMSMDNHWKHLVRASESHLGFRARGLLGTCSIFDGKGQLPAIYFSLVWTFRIFWSFSLPNLFFMVIPRITSWRSTFNS